MFWSGQIFWWQGWRKLWVRSFGTNWIEINLPLISKSTVGKYFENYIFMLCLNWVKLLVPLAKWNTHSLTLLYSFPKMVETVRESNCYNELHLLWLCYFSCYAPRSTRAWKEYGATGTPNFDYLNFFCGSQSSEQMELTLL